MTYGRFDDDSREYVITRSDTPWPWINYLGTGDFFSLVSNAGGGYSFYRDARLRRLTRYRYNDVPADQNGRLFYIKDGPTIWNPGCRPTQTPLDGYECRHGMGYTRIRSRKNGVEAEVLFFVPVGADCEVQRVVLRNTGRTRKNISLFSLTEFCLWNALDDMTNFQRNLSTGEVDVQGNVIFHLTEYRERRDHFSFYSVNVPPGAFETDRESFTGRCGGYAAPQAVVRGNLSGSRASGWSPIAAFQHDIVLSPGEEKRLVFLLGYVENSAAQKWAAPGVANTSKAISLISRFDSEAKVETEFGALQAHWTDLLSRFSLSSGDERLDRMVNTWNQYQCMVTFLMARSASFFESGIGRGIGFRDTSQDLLGCMHQVPDRARQRLFDVASTQRADGGAWHQYQPLTRRGNADVGDGFNDDPLWLILGVAAYLKETGDWEFLDVEVPFDNDLADAAPLFEHLRRSFSHVVDNLGPHGLPLIGRADWNDCLNLNCFSDRPQRVLPDHDQPRRPHGGIRAHRRDVHSSSGGTTSRSAAGQERDAAARAARGALSEMCRSVTEHGWDGEWFLRAYDDAGRKVGSHECEEGRIFIESNAFCAIAEAGAESGHAAARPGLCPAAPGHAITASCCSIRPTPATTWSSGRSPRTRRATRRMPGSFVTTIPGS